MSEKKVTLNVKFNDGDYESYALAKFSPHDNVPQVLTEDNCIKFRYIIKEYIDGEEIIHMKMIPLSSIKYAKIEQ